MAVQFDSQFFDALIVVQLFTYLSQGALIEIYCELEPRLFYLLPPLFNFEIRQTMCISNFQELCWFNFKHEHIR